jgi:hypothetical protein
VAFVATGIKIGAFFIGMVAFALAAGVLFFLQVAGAVNDALHLPSSAALRFGAATSPRLLNVAAAGALLGVTCFAGWQLYRRWQDGKEPKAKSAGR